MIVIVLASFLEEAQKLMHEIFEDERSMVLDFVGIPDTEYMETADSLREIKDKIKVKSSAWNRQKFHYWLKVYRLRLNIDNLITQSSR